MLWYTDGLIQGKDETFLCSLSNFDAYAITRRHKAPKPFAFAVKSSDNISLFENKADYLHSMYTLLLVYHLLTMRM
jgi:hypothetical protein